MMAEVNTPGIYREKSDDDKLDSHIQNQSINPEMNSSCHRENSVPAQVKMRSDYLENLLNSPVDEWRKKNMKEKIVPHLQEDYQNVETLNYNPSSPDENTETTSHDDSSNKIQNIEPSITASSMSVNVSGGIDETENKTTDISLSSRNIVESLEETNIEDPVNATDFFKRSKQNNLEEMNSSLRLICDYGSDSDSDDDDLQTVDHSINILESSEENEKDVMNYRSSQVLFSDDSEDSDSSDEKSESDSSSTSSSSSSSSSCSSVAIENASAVNRRILRTNAQYNIARSQRSLKTKGEMAIDDLPPIEDLCISVPQEECMELGKVTNIVDQLVVVQANKNTPPLDIDSVLFLDHGKQALGQVFDVFGQVSEPLYCIRFNSREHINQKGIERNMTVYCAPKTQHTSYVFMAHLLKAKGSDASWEEDNEPPPKCLDYSDDEEERKARRLLKSDEGKETVEDPEHPMKKKIRSNSFERIMNERNLRMTALHANQPQTPTITNSANHNKNINNTSGSSTNNNGMPRPPAFDSGDWWSGPLPATHTFHRPSLPPPPPCNPSPQRLIHPPTFTLPPPQRFEIPPYPVFSSPPPPLFSSPRGNTAAGPPLPSVFPPFQSPPFLPFNHTFAPPVPPFNPNRPPPSFGFPPAFPPQMPQYHPPPPP